MLPWRPRYHAALSRARSRSASMRGTARVCSEYRMVRAPIYLSIAQAPADAAASLAATRPVSFSSSRPRLVGVRTRSRDRSVGRYKPSKKDDLVGHATHYKQLQETALLRTALSPVRTGTPQQRTRCLRRIAGLAVIVDRGGRYRARCWRQGRQGWARRRRRRRHAEEGGADLGAAGYWQDHYGAHGVREDGRARCRCDYIRPSDPIHRSHCSYWLLLIVRPPLLVAERNASDVRSKGALDAEASPPARR